MKLIILIFISFALIDVNGANIGDSTLPDNFLEPYFKSLANIKTLKVEYEVNRIAKDELMGAWTFQLVAKHGCYKCLTYGKMNNGKESAFPSLKYQLSVMGNSAQYIIGRDDVHEFKVDYNANNKDQLLRKFLFKFEQEIGSTTPVILQPVIWVRDNGTYDKKLGMIYAPEFMSQLASYKKDDYYISHIHKAIQDKVKSAKTISDSKWIVGIKSPNIDDPISLWLIIEKDTFAENGHLIKEWRHASSEIEAINNPLITVSYEYEQVSDKVDNGKMLLLKSASVPKWKNSAMIRLKSVLTGDDVKDGDLILEINQNINF